jgi:hypothetical protein
MRAATRPGGDHGGRHHRIVLATFRPTWRQALARGLGLGALGTLAMAPIASVAVTAPALAEIVSGTALRERTLAHESWFVVLAPLPLGVLGCLALRRWAGARLDELGVQNAPSAFDGFVPWRLVVDIRAERRRGSRSIWRTDRRCGCARRTTEVCSAEIRGSSRRCS